MVFRLSVNGRSFPLLIGVGRAVLLATAISRSVATAQQPSLDVHAFASTTIGLSRDDIAAVERGEPVTRVLTTALSRDVTVFGIIVVNARHALVASFMSTYPAALRTPGRTALGILTAPAIPGELGDLVLSSRDAGALRDCHPGSCAFKLASGDMESMRAELAGSSDSALVSGIMRRRLATIANAYWLHGNAAMPVYDDNGGRSVHGAQAFAALLSQTPNLFAFAPGLRDFLQSYPRAHLPGASDVLYWARDEVSGLQPTATLNQRIVFSPAGAADITIVATKQIVADHYLEAGLEVLLVVDRPPSRGSGVYVMFLRRLRFDQMPKAFFVSLRGRVTARLRHRAEADLLRIRDR